MEAKLIYQKYEEMMELLRSYRERTYRQWVSGVDEDCRFNLGQPLIQRDPLSGLVRVNFSSAVGVSPAARGRPCALTLPHFGAFFRKLRVDCRCETEQWRP